MPEMTIGYKLIRINPTQDLQPIEDQLNEYVRQGYIIKDLLWYKETGAILFLYRAERQA